jgi:hypothetical protein
MSGEVFTAGAAGISHEFDQPTDTELGTAPDRGGL